MTSNYQHRTTTASEAWARLFRNAKHRTTTRHQNTRIAATRETGNTINNPENIGLQKNIPQHQGIHTTPQEQTNSTLSIIQPPPHSMKDNVTWGDKIIEKRPQITRIYSQNVNGIRFEKDGGQFNELCKVHQEVQADVLCIQEHNLDTTQYIVKQTLQQVCHKTWQRARLNLASSPIPFTGTWKPGGTGIMSTESITGRITATGADEWGRWSYHTFQGQNRRSVTIISVYQVVEKFTQDKGTFTTAAQQRSLLLRQQDSLQDPRLAFQRDLRNFLHQHKDQHNEILIIGDFNERLGDNLNGTAQLAAEFS